MRLTVSFGTYWSRPLRLPVSSAVSFSPQMTSVGTRTTIIGNAGGVFAAGSVVDAAPEAAAAAVAAGGGPMPDAR